MTYSFEIQELEKTPVLSITATTTMAELGEVMADCFPTVFKHIHANGGQPAGMPFARYHKFGPEEVVVESGLPLIGAVAGEGRILTSELPGGLVARTIHVGPYESLLDAYQAYETWFADGEYEATGGPWEVYLTDPGEEKDSSKWQTQINWPVKKK
jgi:AraC family transcriptional regulator